MFEFPPPHPPTPQKKGGPDDPEHAMLPTFNQGSCPRTSPRHHLKYLQFGRQGRFASMWQGSCHTVGGSEIRPNHLGYKKTCKWLDKLQTLTGAGCLLQVSTVMNPMQQKNNMQSNNLTKNPSARPKNGGFIQLQKSRNHVWGHTSKWARLPDTTSYEPMRLSTTTSINSMFHMFVFVTLSPVFMINHPPHMA